MTLEEAQAQGIAPWTDLVREDFHVAVYRDAYPVTQGHLLFVPKHETDSLIDNCFSDAMRMGRAMVKAGEWDAFNVGINWGKAAGQTVMYPHIHLIPRYDGDIDDPRGGVRHVIPSKGNYKK